MQWTSLITLSSLAASYVDASKTGSIPKWDDNPSQLSASIVITPNTIAEKPAIILGVSKMSTTTSLHILTIEISSIRVVAPARCISP